MLCDDAQEEKKNRSNQSSQSAGSLLSLPVTNHCQLFSLSPLHTPKLKTQSQAYNNILMILLILLMYVVTLQELAALFYWSLYKFWFIKYFLDNTHILNHTLSSTYVHPFSFLSQTCRLVPHSVIVFVLCRIRSAYPTTLLSQRQVSVPHKYNLTIHIY